MRGFRFLAVVAAIAMMIVGGSPGPASASVTGPCTAQVNGADVTAGHDTASTAVDVDYRSEVTYSGESTGGDVGTLKVTLEVAGFGLRSHEMTVSGSTWSDSVAIEKYAWAGVGLYLVRGVASNAGGPLCTGTAYICISGKSAFLTAAGIAAVALAGLALILAVWGLIARRRISRAGMAWRFGLAGLLGGVGVPVLLQQTCTVPLTRNIALGSVGGGLLGMLLLGILLGVSRGQAPGFELPAGRAAAPTANRDDRTMIYRFSPPADACTACRNHAAHRTYRTMEAITPDRAHPGCHCEIVAEPRQRAEVVAMFSGRGDVFDDRGA